jgi:hypothetical protein
VSASEHQSNGFFLRWREQSCSHLGDQPAKVEIGAPQKLFADLERRELDRVVRVMLHQVLRDDIQCPALVPEVRSVQR